MDMAFCPCARVNTKARQPDRPASGKSCRNDYLPFPRARSSRDERQPWRWNPASRAVSVRVSRTTMHRAENGTLGTLLRKTPRTCAYAPAQALRVGFRTVSQPSHLQRRASVFMQQDGTNAGHDVSSDDSTPRFAPSFRTRHFQRCATKTESDDHTSGV